MKTVAIISKNLPKANKWLSKSSLSKKIILVFVFFLICYLIYSRLSTGKKQPQYQTARVERGTIISSISASGNVLASNFVNVATQSTGIVKEVYVKEGDKVSAGQKIAEIILDRDGQQKNASAWSNYLAAKNNLESAKANLYSLNSAMWAANQKFINDAVARGLPSNDPTYIQENSDWLAAEAKYKNQKLVIDQAEASLNSAWLSYQESSPTIVAPVGGVVKNITIVPGMVLSSANQTTTSPQRVAIIVSKERPAIISVNITEIDVPKVKIGQKATVVFDSLPDKTFTGKTVSVDRIGVTSNNVTSYPSLIELDTTSSEILPNMAVTANIILETKTNVLLVPSAAIRTEAGQSFVRVLKEGREEQTLIEIGLQGDTQTEIISGLSEGDEIIIGEVTTQTQQGRSIFGGGGFGGGAFRPGGFIIKR